jgi:STE24 endopeptidase
MSSFSILFVCFFLLNIALRLYLENRQIRHILLHRDAVPAQFANKINLTAHQKAADYTIAKTKVNLTQMQIGAFVVLGFTLLGGLELLSHTLFAFTNGGMTYQISLIVAFFVISALIDLPIEYYKQFVIEERFGFNKMTPTLYVVDLIKGLIIGSAIGLPLLWVTLSLMEGMGNAWWFYCWLIWCAFQLLMLIIYPTFIAPLFNKFTPLTDQSLRNRIEDLMHRTGFTNNGLFVMDGSKRSAHGNAYFSGLGSAKRIVFFDTLLERLNVPEIEAVLAHELGHFKLKHVIKRIGFMFILSFLFLALLGYLKNQAWFYVGLGVTPILMDSNNAMALILFIIALPVFTFIFSPVTSWFSRKHEFEADAFAAQYSPAQDLINALVKLYEDNASTLTPDPLYSTFYHSHPPASIRISELEKLKSTT